MLNGLKVVIFAFMIFYLASSASACSCLQPGSPLKELQEADAVFTGKVIQIQEGSFGGVNKIKFQVDKAWKGASGNEIVISTPSNEGLCSYTFEVGESYIIYASGNEVLSTSICSRTKKLSFATRDLVELGNGVASPSVDLPVLPNYQNYDIAIVVAGLILAVFILYTILRRRH